jgi:two-component system response regulator QseB
MRVIGDGAEVICTIYTCQPHKPHTETAMRLLLIEDDPMIGKSIRDGLRREGYSVDWVRDGWAGEQSVKTQDYDMLILDLGLPRKDGLAVLSSIRASGKIIPVLIITARSEVDDRVAGLDAGADDYLVKPFSMPELNARVRALLRRSFGRADTVIQAGDLEINPQSREVHIGGKNIALSQRELALLEQLMQRPGAIVSKSSLEGSIYAWGEEVESNTIEVHISNLRKKLGADRIITVRGIGYRINPK